MLRLEQIDHVALTVADVKSSVAWYRDVLGLERRHEEVWGSYPAVMYAGPTGIALFPAAAAPPDPSGLRHVAFRVDAENFERARGELKARDIEFTFEDHTITHSIYFHDPDGYMIELTTHDLKR